MKRTKGFRDKVINLQQRGLILVEAVVGLAMAGFAVAGLTLIFTTGLNAYHHARLFTQAVYISESHTEQCLSGELTSLSESTTWIEMVNGSVFTIQQKSALLPDNNTIRQVDISVQWHENNGLHQTRLISQGVSRP